MENVEIESVLEEAGFLYDIGAHRFVSDNSEDTDECYEAQDIADALDIPLEDLARWEQLQQHRDDAMAG